jgi:hypothetical protein
MRRPMTTSRITKRRRPSALATDLQLIAASALEARTTRDVPPLTENLGRGRLLFVPDIEQEVLRGRYTSTWIVRFFAPEAKRKIGRRPCWWERDALAWIDAQHHAPGD